MKTKFFIILLLIMLLPVGGVWGAYYLDGINGVDNGTCGDAIGAGACKTYAQLKTNKSVANCTVIIYPATYTEQFVPEGTAVIFQASNWVAGQQADPATHPIISPASLAGAVKIDQTNGTVRGLCVTGQTTTNHIGVYISVADGAIVEDCAVYDNSIGIQYYNSTVEIRRNKFYRNSTDMRTLDGIEAADTVNIHHNIQRFSSQAYYLAAVAGKVNIYNNDALGMDLSFVNLASVSGESAEINIIGNIALGAYAGGDLPVINYPASGTIAGTIDYNYLSGGDIDNGNKYLDAEATAFDGGHNIYGTSDIGLTSYADGTGWGNISFDDATDANGFFDDIVAMLTYMSTKGMKGTWYVDFRNVGDIPARYTWDQAWAAIYTAYQQGHEIGCHSLSHWQTTLTNMFKLTRTGGTTPQVIITNNGSTGTIKFYDNSLQEGDTITFTAPSDADLLSNAAIFDIAYLKTHLPAGWALGSQSIQAKDTMLLQNLNPATYASGDYITPFKGTYSTGLPTTADGVYYWEITKAKDILEKKMVSLGATGFTAKTFGYPAWTYDATSRAAVKGSDFIGARTNDASTTNTNRFQTIRTLTDYGFTPFNLGLQFSTANVWSAGAVSTPTVRAFAYQAATNYRIFSTMFHGYTQFDAAAVYADFTTFIDAVYGTKISIVSMSDIIQRVLDGVGTYWQTADGYTYTRTTWLPDLTNALLRSGSPGRNMVLCTDSVWNGVPNVTSLNNVAITDASGNCLVQYVSAGAYQYVPSGGGFGSGFFFGY